MAEVGGPPSRHYTIADLPAAPGTRTVCLGRRSGGVRVVGCFDVYRLEAAMYDPTKKANVRQFVWKYTAEARAEDAQLTRLQNAVTSEAGDTYDWGPGASVQFEHPGSMTAAVTTDLLPQRVPGQEAPRVASQNDGWDFEALAGWVDPYLNDHLHSVTWSAPKGKAAPKAEPAQVAGASIWGLTDPAPDVMPAHLRVEAGYR